MIRRPPRSTLFPYPPLFRSRAARARAPFVRTPAARPTAATAPGAGRRSPVTHFQPACARDSGVQLQALSRRLVELRSEEHTSELPSPDHILFRLLLEKKKKN